MKINGYKFGHPVFGVSDYYDFSPQCNIDSKIEDDHLFLFSDDINLGDNYILLEMLQNREAVLIAEVYCTYTMYRRVFIQKDRYNIKIPLENLKNKVEASFMIIANQDLVEFKNPSIRDDAKDLSFYVEKGEVLGYFGEFNFELDLEGMTLDSIVKFRSKVTERDLEIDYIFQENSIIIELPKSDYESLEKYALNPDYQKLLVASILQTALVHACYKLADDQFEEKSWFRALRIHWQKMNDESDYPVGDEVIQFVEKLLKQPTSLLIKTLGELDEKNKNMETE